MKKITSLFLSLLLVVSITSSYADHHEKSVEKEIQAALKAGKITEEEAKEKLAYLKRREAESKKIAKTKKSPAKKKAEQEAAKKKAPSILFPLSYMLLDREIVLSIRFSF